MDKPKTYNEWHSSLQGFEGLSHANCCKISYEAGQQSQQAELDRLNEVLDERTKEWLEAIKLGTYFQEAAKPLKDELDELSSQNQILKEVAESDTKTIERLESVINLNDSELKEKDKRIDVACKSINSFFDNQVSTPTPREYANFIAEILEALRGDNANS